MSALLIPSQAFAALHFAFEHHERFAHIERLKLRLAELVDNLIPTAEDAHWLGWLGALEEERIALEAELNRLEHEHTERDELGALRVAL